LVPSQGQTHFHFMRQFQFLCGRGGNGILRVSARGGSFVSANQLVMPRNLGGLCLFGWPAQKVLWQRVGEAFSLSARFRQHRRQAFPVFNAVLFSLFHSVATTRHRRLMFQALSRLTQTDRIPGDSVSRPLFFDFELKARTITIRGTHALIWARPMQYSPACMDSRSMDRHLIHF